jgi:hypothetical protein
MQLIKYFKFVGAYCTYKTIVIHIYFYLLRLLKAADSSDMAGFRLINISILSVWKTKLIFYKTQTYLSKRLKYVLQWKKMSTKEVVV